MSIIGDDTGTRIARRLRLDVVHDPVGISPFTLGHWAGRFRRVVTIHDAIAFRYPEGESTYERFLVHKTVFPRDFLADFGFQTVRAEGRVELARLELGGLLPVVEGKRSKVLKVVREAFAPEPVPQRP